MMSALRPKADIAKRNQGLVVDQFSRQYLERAILLLTKTIQAKLLFSGKGSKT
jgi:hypothetical protein